jgi:hypothetical protein
VAQQVDRHGGAKERADDEADQEGEQHGSHSTDRVEGV